MSVEQKQRHWQTYQSYKPSGIEWLGHVPEHWEVRRLKTVARFGYGDSLTADDRVAGPYNVYGSNGVVDQHNQANTKSPCLIIGRKGSFGKVSFSDKPCFAIDTTYFVDSRLTANDLRWLYFSLQWLRLDTISKDSAVPGLSREDAYENRLAFCSLTEQRAIASFLDRETTRIDALIEKKHRQIELLQEKRSAMISHAVTKGLDPDVRMKDSGIEWLGEIPENWEVKSVRRIASSVKTGSTPSGADEIYFDQNGFNWYTPSDFNDKITLEESHRKLSELGKKEVRIFPAMTVMMIGIGATIGKVALSRESASCNQQINTIICNSAITPKFLTYFLKIIRDYVILCGKFTTLPIINQEDTKNLIITCPPIPEQNEIVSFLDKESDKTDALIKKIFLTIDKLCEYRTALISAAVTGKIDVHREVPDAS